MEIIFKSESSYFASSLRSEPTAAKGAAAQEENAKFGVSSADRVDISAEGRSLQQALSGEAAANVNSEESENKYDKKKSRLMNSLAGNEEDNDKRLAYGGSVGSSGGGSEDDDTAIRIRELQSQLREALNRLQEARQELSEAQAANINEVKAMQQGETPQAMFAGGQQSGEALAQAQQKVATASAEVNSVQEQLQKMLVEQANAAKKNGSSQGASVGQVWESQGTNDYIGGNW